LTVRYQTVNVAVFRLEGGLYAIDDACTHEDGPLGEGDVVGTVVTCPYHDWRFDVSTGECLSYQNRHVACYEVKEHGGIIWVGKRTRDGSLERGGQHDDGLNTPEIRI
jgi:nitrite reductase/ring-hydroxylating ferredoxin subunit